MARLIQILADGRPGGGTTAVLSLSRLLAAGGNEVSIITQESSHLLREAAFSGLDTIGLDFSSRSKTVSIATTIAYHLRKLEPAVVHAHGARAGLPTALISHRVTKWFVYTVHGFHFFNKPILLRQLARSAEALCIARADCTVFVSDADLALARRLHVLAQSKAHRIIKNAVSIDADAMAAHKTHDIGFLGRLHYQKNPLILIDVLKAMRPLRPSLCVIGGGELESALLARSEAEGMHEQITMYGECGRAEALRRVSSCRVLVLPSRWEGHPIALIEAMHLGLPVVASNVPGSDEIVVDGETGYLVPSLDIAAYADRLKRLLGDTVLRTRMSHQAQHRAHSEYSVSRMLVAHMEIYSGLRHIPESAAAGY